MVADDSDLGAPTPRVPGESPLFELVSGACAEPLSSGADETAEAATSQMSRGAAQDGSDLAQERTDFPPRAAVPSARADEQVVLSLAAQMHGASADDLVLAALSALPSKPSDAASAADKKRYSELMSNAVALAMAEALRRRGMRGALPGAPGSDGRSGAERRLAGGLGAKKVDVSWATEESGLIFAVSVKTINFRDSASGAFQKNLTNRRADLLMEATTLHRRFPYAVLSAVLILDKDAAADGTVRRLSTFANAFPRFRLFSGRSDPAGRDEQFERLYICLVEATAVGSTFEMYDAAQPGQVVSVDEALDGLMELVVERNFDDYESDGRGGVRKL